jgi:hypothetical protein
MVEAAGIEHFAKSIKTIRYRVVVPKSCLKICTAFDYHHDTTFSCPKIRKGSESSLARLIRCHKDSATTKGSEN